MIEMLQSLFAHMAWADNALLGAVAKHDGGYDDEQIRKWLLHIVTVEKFFLSLFEQQPFDQSRESKMPASAAEMEQRFAESHAQAAAYAARINDAEMQRRLDFPALAKDFHPTVADAMLQVAMHSEHHRGQVAARLRALGGSPVVLDYIVWVRQVKNVPPA